MLQHTYLHLFTLFLSLSLSKCQEIVQNREYFEIKDNNYPKSLEIYVKVS